RDEPRHPVTNVSWDQITGPGGFIHHINASEILRAVSGGDETLCFRLPSETEWEYAARGGRHWTDGFAFSGSSDIDKVAWYGPRFSRARRLVCRLLGWRLGWRFMGRFPRGSPTHTHPVATKAANQLGLYDMCGNVWEWCQDECIDDVTVTRSRATEHRGWAKARTDDSAADVITIGTSIAPCGFVMGSRRNTTTGALVSASSSPPRSSPSARVPDERQNA
ncbi:MAG: SUMF1/EgtB/PvdO family nonheme iron enzyme, partial [Verrucomicrobia bacterium]|nr:SUMF1/EgtB/PvdO family nonheme iron enzyme [Verrucomicrobiota bacterium]